MSNSSAEQAVNVLHAFFIKLGRAGQWEKDSIENGLIRVGWQHVPLAEINSKNWEIVQTLILNKMPDRGAAKRDLNALRQLTTSTENDVWITFHAACLFWCRVAPALIEEDAVSKFRRTLDGWNNRDLEGNQLQSGSIPGVISQLQGFRGTVCKVSQVNRLRDLLNGKASTAHQAVSHARTALIHEVRNALDGLHWKDFEILVDLLFRQAGWRRLGVLGETMKFADIELEEPVNHERYQVQIKARADLSDFQNYASQFADKGFRKLFFVVHSPSASLAAACGTDRVELVLPGRLAEMVVDAGLVSWLLTKIK
jgi:hypothetical protein